MILVTPEWSTKGFDKLPTGWAAQLSWAVSGADNERQAVDAVPIRQGNSHPLATRLVCQSVGIQDTMGPNYFRVAARFDQRPFPFGSNDPLEAEASYSWNLGGQGVQVHRDHIGNLITNSAGEVPTNTLTRFVSVVELHVSRNEPNFDLPFLLPFANTINSTDWIIEGVRIPRLLALCRGITPTARYTKSSGYATVGYSFLILPPVTEMEKQGRASPHEHMIPDVGFRSFFDNNGTAKPDVITFAGSSKQPQKPVRLNGKGKIIDAGYTVNGNDSIDGSTPKGAVVDKSGDSYFLRYQATGIADFNKLGL